MRKSLISMALMLIVPQFNLFSQNSGALAEKPGTFEILSRTDYAGSDWGFSKTDVTANLGRIKDLVNVMRQNPVLSDIKGFNGRARIYTVTWNEVEKYGIPSRISFEFSSFFYSRDGKVVWNIIEPPEWSLFINDMIPGWSDGFNSKHGYFTAPLKKETVEPGIDVYDGECWVLYDPSRPAYWLPVTVREAWQAVWEEFKKEKDEVAAQYMKEMLDNEYAAFSESDMDKPAYFGGNLSRISVSPGFEGQNNIFPAIMKVNTAYWNKALPASAIQFIWFRSVQNKEYMKSRLDECRRHMENESGTGCDLTRFELSFGMTDIRNLSGMIGL